MAYKVKSKKKIVKLTKPQKMKLLHDHAKKEKYPKYAWFFGKERRKLLDKMHWTERKKLKKIDMDIFEVSTVTDFVSIGGASMLAWMMPTLIVTTPVAFLSTRHLKRRLNERRAFLREMHTKYK